MNGMDVYICGVITGWYCCRVSELLDYTAEELTGMNLYTLCHGEDVQRLRKCHVDCKYSWRM